MSANVKWVVTAKAELSIQAKWGDWGKTKAAWRWASVAVDGAGKAEGDEEAAGQASWGQFLVSNVAQKQTDVCKLAQKS